jgi:hypothetical protein
MGGCKICAGRDRRRGRTLGSSDGPRRRAHEFATTLEFVDGNRDGLVSELRRLYAPTLGARVHGFEAS